MTSPAPAPKAAGRMGPSAFTAVAQARYVVVGRERVRVVEMPMNVVTAGRVRVEVVRRVVVVVVVLVMVDCAWVSVDVVRTVLVRVRVEAGRSEVTAGRRRIVVIRVVMCVVRWPGGVSCTCFEKR